MNLCISWQWISWWWTSWYIMTLNIDIIPALPHWMITHNTITSKIVLSCYGSAVVCGIQMKECLDVAQYYTVSASANYTLGIMWKFVFHISYPKWMCTPRFGHWWYSPVKCNHFPLTVQSMCCPATAIEWYLICNNNQSWTACNESYIGCQHCACNGLIFFLVVRMGH